VWFKAIGVFVPRCSRPLKLFYNPQHSCRVAFDDLVVCGTA